MEHNVDYHLREALRHLEAALNQSVNTIVEDNGKKKEIGLSWEQFLGQFMGMVREQGKKTKINLLGLVSFSRIR
ncbi:hypothetical protein [Paenibacillus sp. GP183]|jgi:hypothetical protein|uniref:hypothetical protein n=1 Tax=Paenibacillus sp. GP183 TaxID=1882751 RepID=UPI00089B7ED9|nr:hypothetical protein [Paenibacillus sp. GP183]SEB62647.1 hypothetical protein SAMN05443246_1355 [Paenibacillus sp. GP183]